MRTITFFFLLFVMSLTVLPKTLAQGKWTTFTETDGLVTNWNQTIFIDGDSIWFGGSFNSIGGAQLYYQGSWTTFNTDNSGLLHNSVWSYAKDNENNIWIASVGGLNKFDGSLWTSYPTANTVRDVFIDHDINIWICTYGGGVSYYNGISWTTYTESDGLISNNVLYGVQHNDGTFWFVTTYGINSFDGTNWESYTSLDGLTDDNTRSIYIDYSNNIWIGSIDGLSMYNGENWTKIIEQEDIRISAIGQDIDSNIWIGSDDHQGVYKYDGYQWINYTSPSSLLANYINAIACDQYGRIWFSGSGTGVTQLIPYELIKNEQTYCGDSIKLQLSMFRYFGLLQQALQAIQF